MLREAGISPQVLGTDLDRAYVDRLLEQLEASELDALVLLAQDLPHSAQGDPLPDKSGFYVPNDYLFTVCEQSPDRLIPAISVHPGRPDALDELDRCIARGAKVLKLLPNCLNIDYASPRFHAFWDKVAEAGIVLLSHTGGEHTVPVIEAAYADPRLLETPLERGVTVIAAHAAGQSGLWDPDYSDALFAMFDRFPRLYADNSALCSLNRSHTIRRIFDAGVMERIIHGSDFPVPVIGFGPYQRKLIDRKTWQESRQQRHPIQRDVQLKQAIGFPEETFTRLDALLP